MTSFGGWYYQGWQSDLWACWMKRLYLSQVAEADRRALSAPGDPGQVDLAQNKKKLSPACLEKKTVESRAAQTYVELIGAITFLHTGRNRMSRSRPRGLRTRRKPTLSFRSGRRSLAASLIGSGERSSCSPSGQQTRQMPAKHCV